MRYLSLFSGIEAASAAWEPLDWKSAGFAEVEPFPCAVLKHHYPEVPNLGDVTAEDFVDRVKALGPFEVLIGGSPCQAFSVAGLRQSLDDHRGNLTLRFVEIVDALRPAITLWENVPGVLSTKDNAFGCFLAGLSGADAPLVLPGKPRRWPDAGVVVGPRRRVAWRILDAQHFRLAQRRRRVFIIACPVAGADPAEILFVENRLPGYSPPSRKTRQGVAGGAATSLAIRGRGDGRNAELGDPDLANSLLTPNGGRDGMGAGEVLAPEGRAVDCADTLGVGANQTTGFESEVVAVAVGVPATAWALQERDSKGVDSSTKDGHLIPIVIRTHQTSSLGDGISFDLSHTLNQDSGRGQAIAFNHQEDRSFHAEAELTNPQRVSQTEAVGYPTVTHSLTTRSAVEEDGTGRGVPIIPVAFAQNTRDEANLIAGDGSLAGALAAEPGMKQQTYVAGFLPSQGSKALGIGYEEEMAPTSQSGCHDYGVQQQYQVRRLLPEECESLQGFPQGYTRIPWRGKPAADCPDGPRYKALGNSMAVPVIQWLGRQIEKSFNGGVH